jgi:hypothetical protein
MLMKNILLATTFLTACVMATGHTEAVQGLARMTLDQFGNVIQSGYPACGYVNQASVAAPGTMQSITWPTGTTDIIFYPPDSTATIYGRPNGTGACPTGAVTNGTGCEKNMGHRRVDVLISNTIAITSYGVTSDVTSTIIRYCAYNKNKQ